MKFLIFSLFVTLSSADFFTENPCGPIATNVDVTKYEGTWYEVLRTSNDFESGFNCAKSEVYVVNNHTMHSKMCEMQNGKKDCFESETYQIGNDGICVGVSTDINIINMFYVMETNSENYLISYDCTFDYNKGKKMMRNVWVVTREVPLNEELTNEVYQKLHKYMDVDRLKVINHDKELCGY